MVHPYVGVKVMKLSKYFIDIIFSEKSSGLVNFLNLGQSI
jgi:hypothetical protein